MKINPYNSTRYGSWDIVFITVKFYCLFNTKKPEQRPIIYDTIKYFRK